MKFHKISRRLAAALMAGTMMVSMVGMTAFAAGVQTSDTGLSEVTVKKTVTTDGNTYAPNVTFNFNVTTGADGTYDGNVVYAGVDGGLAVKSGAVFAPTAGTVSAEYTADGKLAVDASAFTKPGVYHYVVSEADVTYEGIKKDTSVYDVYVYVYNNAENTGYVVKNVVSVKQGSGETAEKADLAFVNDYGKDDDNDTTHDITITKKITGNQADPKATFAFTVSVAGGEGELYKVLVNDAEVAPIVSGGDAVTYTIGNNGTIQIFGLSEKDAYTVVETAANTDGYTTTIDGASTTDGSKTGTVSADNTVVTYENNKNVGTPTGVAMTVAPYILMVALAGVFAFLFLRRRNRAEY